MRFNLSSIDKTLLISVIALILFGIVVLATASTNIAQERFGDPAHYLKRQLLIGGTAGLAAFLFGLFFPYRFWRRLALFLFLLNLILLVAVFFPPFGVKIKGAWRWLEVYRGISFQPSELLKITLVLYLAAIFEKRNWQASSFRHGFIPFLIVLAFSVALVAVEPDITTAVIIAGSAVVVYWSAGGRFNHFALLIAIIAAGFLVMIYLAPHSSERLKTFLNQIAGGGSGYHSYQIKQSVISGGLIGNTKEQGIDKYRLLPEPFGDSIFAVAAAEFGFAGASLILAAFLIFIVRCAVIASRIHDTFGRLVVIGLASAIGLQAFVNIGAMAGLLPIAGIPLPFLSHGGSSLAVNLFSFGLILNISRYQR